MITRDEVMSLVRSPEEAIPERTKFWGTYYGIVEDNRDPLRLNRLRVRTALFQDTESMPTQSLPWAHCVGPSGGDLDVGFYFVPPIGSQVAVTFHDGHPAYPMWVGTVWGAPNGVSETHVSTIVEDDPYGLQGGASLPFGSGWDYTKYNSLTTPSGHKLEFDDNLARIRPDTPFETRINYRRIGLETRGDEILTLSAIQGTFAIGQRVVGDKSTASGEIVRIEGSDVTVSGIQGKYSLGETISSDDESASGTLDAVEKLDGFHLRMRLDKTLDARTVTPYEEFHGIMELGTPGGRTLKFDDAEPVGPGFEAERGTIRFDTPDNHFFEINSATNFIHAQTEEGHFLRFDDEDDYIDLATVGDDPTEFGFRLRLDQTEQQALLKGDEDDYHLMLDETTSQAGGSIGLYRGLRRVSGRSERGLEAGVEVGDWVYGTLPNRGNVVLWAGGTPGENGIHVEYGATSSPFGPRAKSIYMYDTSRVNPAHIIRLVSEDNGAPGVEAGQVDIGANTGSGPKLSLKPVSLEATLSSPLTMNISGINTTITGSSIVQIADSSKLSSYFDHRHRLDWLSPDNLGIQLTLTGTFPPAGPGAAVVSVTAATRTHLLEPLDPNDES